MNTFKLLFTRKIRTVARLAEQPQVDVTELEFIRTEATGKMPRELPNNAALAFTSANAVRYFSAHRPTVSSGWKVCGLEGATASSIFELLKVNRLYLAAANAGLLAREIIKDGSIKKLFFICGDLRRDELPEALRAAGILVEEAVVYKTILTPHRLDADFDGVAFFSPSAVESFFSTNRVSDRTMLFSIGDTTTGAIKKYTSNPVITSKKSSEEHMTETIIHYINEKRTQP